MKRLRTIDITKPIARGLFTLSCLAGRPIGGLRPHRFVHLLAQHGFGDAAPSPEQFRWVRDNFGSEFLVHPYYLIDRYILAFGSYESALHRYIQANVWRGAVVDSQRCDDSTFSANVLCQRKD